MVGVGLSGQLSGLSRDLGCSGWWGIGTFNRIWISNFGMFICLVF